MEPQECPITRAPIQKGDAFKFRTQSGNEIVYSATAIAEYLEFSGKLLCPLTRERLSLRDLENISKRRGQKINFLTNFQRFWRTIINSSVRIEAKQLLFTLLSDEVSTLKRENQVVSILILLQDVVGAGAARNLFKEARQVFGSVQRVTKIETLLGMLAGHVCVDVQCYQNSAEFKIRALTEKLANGLNVGGNLPSFEVTLGCKLPPSLFIRDRGRALLLALE